MDETRFDEIARRFGVLVARRALFGGMLGLTAVATGLANAEPAAARCGRRKPCGQCRRCRNGRCKPVSGAACGPCKVCRRGACVDATGSVDLQTDPNNCGGCGNVCQGDGQIACVAGLCEVVRDFSVPGTYTWIVPGAGVVTAEVFGAAGGAGGPASGIINLQPPSASGGVGGKGGSVKASFAVVAGEPLSVAVGRFGFDGGAGDSSREGGLGGPVGGIDGFPGGPPFGFLPTDRVFGGGGGGGGGGASEVRRGFDPLVIAGGGGGGGGGGGRFEGSSRLGEFGVGGYGGNGGTYAGDRSVPNATSGEAGENGQGTAADQPAGGQPGVGGSGYGASQAEFGLNPSNDGRVRLRYISGSFG